MSIKVVVGWLKEAPLGTLADDAAEAELLEKAKRIMIGFIQQKSKESTFQTCAVLAGAYKGKRLSERQLHTHTVRLENDRFAEVLSKSTVLQSMADSEADDPDVRPTCPRCAKKDPRWQVATDGNRVVSGHSGDLAESGYHQSGPHVRRDGAAFMTTGRSCTSGSKDFPTNDAAEWGACECGKGAYEHIEDEDEAIAVQIPLFKVRDKLLCAGCARDALEGGANES